MIKINLLESITDRPTGAAMVEAKVASPRVQTLLLALTVFSLLVVGAGYDYVSSQSEQMRPPSTNWRTRDASTSKCWR